MFREYGDGWYVVHELITIEYNAPLNPSTPFVVSSWATPRSPSLSSFQTLVSLVFRLMNKTVNRILLQTGTSQQTKVKKKIECFYDKAHFQVVSRDWKYVTNLRKIFNVGSIRTRECELNSSPVSDPKPGSDSEGC